MKPLPQHIRRNAHRGDIKGLCRALISRASQLETERAAALARAEKAEANAERYRLVTLKQDAANAALREALQQMIDVAEHCDETGYAEGVGFVDIGKLHDKARAALAGGGRQMSPLDRTGRQTSPALLAALSVMSIGALLGGRTIAERRTEGPGVLPWPKGQRYNAEQDKRHREERIAAAQAKRERKTAKKSQPKEQP